MKISKGTIIRTIAIVLVVINMILKRCGIDVINVSESEIGMVVETAIEIGVIATGFWYNNSFTEKARKADEFMRALDKSEE